MVKIALFDLDKTLLSIDCEREFFVYLKKTNNISNEDFLKNENFYHSYENGKLSIKSYSIFFVNIINKINDFNKILKKFMVIIKKSYIVGMMKILRLHIKKKHICLITTSSYRKISYPICKNIFGIKDVICNDYKKKNNILTSSLKGISNYGKGKIENFLLWKNKKRIKKCKTFFYSDSINDLPLLKYVDNAYAVNPDNILLSETKKNEKIKLLIFN
ncbi:HAD family hydrolase [Candidatus Vidania fulgoroideorum]